MSLNVNLINSILYPKGNIGDKLKKIYFDLQARDFCSSDPTENPCVLHAFLLL